MKITLKLTKGDKVLCAASRDVTDAESFGTAFADLWTGLHSARMQRSTSVGELMDAISDDILDDVNGAQIVIEKI